MPSKANICTGIKWDCKRNPPKRTPSSRQARKTTLISWGDLGGELYNIVLNCNKKPEKGRGDNNKKQTLKDHPPRPHPPQPPHTPRSPNLLSINPTGTAER